MRRSNLIRRIQQPTIFRMLNLHKGEFVLDGGCGAGYYISGIMEHGAVPVAVDWKTNEVIKRFQRGQPKLRFLRVDVQKLPFADDAFDKVLLSSVLQMVKNDKALLMECRRVLKDSGMLVLSVTVGYRFINKLNSAKPQLKVLFDVNGTGYYSPSEVEGLLGDCGFKVLEVEYSPLALGSWVYEVELFLWYRFRLPFLSTGVYPLFGFFARFDCALGGCLGDELVVKAQKA